VADITIIGTGTAARVCSDVLARAGFNVSHRFELETGERSPVILGDIQGAHQIARQAVEAGRHLMITGVGALSPERLATLLQDRKRSQAIFVWSESRYHPGYRFVAGLVESDNTWRPRFLRLDNLSTEVPSTALMRWRTLEVLVLAVALADEAPVSVNARGARNQKRSCLDQLEIGISYDDLEAFLRIGLGEPIERRETLLAAQTRKIFVDELNQSTPIRIVEDDPKSPSGARWLACPAPSSDEIARQQCVAFLDATIDGRKAQDEASVWLRSLAVLDAVDASLVAHGGPVDVDLTQAEPRFRLIPGRLRPSPPSVA
jgi:hypothetical protein